MYPLYQRHALRLTRSYHRIVSPGEKSGLTMPTFEYHAIDGKGRSRRGILNGDSARQARAALRRDGLFPTRVSAVREGRLKTGPRARIPAASLALLTRQLATLVRAGMPLDESLNALGEQVSSRPLQAALAGVRNRVAEGCSLHEALAGYPGIFPELYRNMVAAGEAGGRLEEALERLADYTEDRHALIQSISMALIYPIILTLVSLLVIAALLVYVVPEVVRVFEQTGQDLPALTAGLIACSKLLREYGLFVGFGLSAALALCWWILQWDGARARRDRLLLELPYLGRLIRTLHAARLARALAILTSSGTPLLDALEISGRLIANAPLRAAVEDAAQAVREGGRLHVALQAHRWFPPLMLRMLAAGETSGELDGMLARAAEQQERELKSAVSMATSLFEPVIILLMGALVLVIVLAVLLPIFEMNQLAGL